jgi:hypothetical protein
MRFAAVLFLLIGFAGPAAAESCTRSSEYIIDGLAGDLTRPAAIYRDLLKTCMETLQFPNVDDAYVMKDGGIAIKSKRDTVAATAETLAQFCQQFPKGVARFITAKEQRKRLTVGLVVLMSSVDSPSCSKIREPS